MGTMLRVLGAAPTAATEWRRCGPWSGRLGLALCEGQGGYLCQRLQPPAQTACSVEVSRTDDRAVWSVLEAGTSLSFTRFKIQEYKT